MEDKNQFSAQGSTSGEPKSKKGPIIIGVVIILLILVVLFFIGTSDMGSNNSDGQNIGSDANEELTEEERQAIIDQLEEEDEAGAELSEEERQAIIGELEAEGGAETELTEEERNEIINSLNE